MINNYYGRLQVLILLFKTPMDTLKNFFEIYTQFGHEPSKSFPIPAVVYGLYDVGFGSR